MQNEKNITISLVKDSEGKVEKRSVFHVNKWSYADTFRDTLLAIKGPCTTVTNVQLGDRLTSVSFKWL